MDAGPPSPTIEELVPLYYAALYRYAYRLAGSAGEAEDLTQDTFCTAQAKRSQLRDPARVKSWLFSILRNAYLHGRRGRKRLQAMAPAELDGFALTADDSELPLVESHRLQAALNALPEEYRSPLILYYFEEFSYKEIAEQMGTPIGTVMSRLARAKEHIRKRLGSPEK
jgi:RNA polymerase sigma-70 factor (ECF subfamily)